MSSLESIDGVNYSLDIFFLESIRQNLVSLAFLIEMYLKLMNFIYHKFKLWHFLWFCLRCNSFSLTLSWQIWHSRLRAKKECSLLRRHSARGNDQTIFPTERNVATAVSYLDVTRQNISKIRWMNDPSRVV